MLEVKFENGETYNFNDLKGYLRNFGMDYLLFDMARGNLPLFLQHNSHRDYLRLIFDAAEKQNLSLEEKGWLDLLNKVLDSVDDLLYDYAASKDKDARSKCLLRHGIILSKLFDLLIDGYVNKTNLGCPACPDHNKGATWESWKKELSILDQFVRDTKRIFVRDKSGIMYPIDLNIVD